MREKRLRQLHCPGVLAARILGHEVERVAVCADVLGNALEDPQVAILRAVPVSTWGVDNADPIRLRLRGVEAIGAAKVFMERVFPLVRASVAPDALPVVRHHALLSNDVGTPQDVSAGLQASQYFAQVLQSLGVVVQVSPHHPVTGGQLRAGVAGGSEVVNVRPVHIRKLTVVDAAIGRVA